MILGGTLPMEVRDPPRFPGDGPYEIPWEAILGYVLTRMYSHTKAASLSHFFQQLAMNRASIPVNVRGLSLEHNSDK